MEPTVWEWIDFFPQTSIQSQSQSLHFVQIVLCVGSLDSGRVWLFGFAFLHFFLKKIYMLVVETCMFSIFSHYDTFSIRLESSSTLISLWDILVNFSMIVINGVSRYCFLCCYTKQRVFKPWLTVETSEMRKT